MRNNRFSRQLIALIVMTGLPTWVAASQFEVEFKSALELFTESCATHDSTLSEIWSLIGNRYERSKNCDRRAAQTVFSKQIDKKYFKTVLSDDAFRSGPLSLFDEPVTEIIDSDKSLTINPSQFTNRSNSQSRQIEQALPGFTTKHGNGASR